MKFTTLDGSIAEDTLAKTNVCLRLSSHADSISTSSRKQSIRLNRTTGSRSASVEVNESSAVGH